MPSINRYIMTIARCSNQFRSERLRDTGLCGQHCAYILRVCREPGTTQDAIAREIYVNKSNVTRQLAALEQNGFVERRPCETDSRAMEVYPTEKRLRCCRRCVQCSANGMNASRRISPRKRRNSSRICSRVLRSAHNSVWMK